jgi:hypothetical protein
MKDPDKQHEAWQRWYDTHKDEYNEMRSRQRDAKRGYVINDSVHRKKNEPHPNPNVKIVVRKVMTATEQRRRKITLELEKVERRRAQWINQQNSRPAEEASAHSVDSL